MRFPTTVAPAASRAVSWAGVRVTDNEPRFSSTRDARRSMPRFADRALEANLAVVEAVRSVAQEQRATPAQVALAWLRYRAAALGVASVPIPGTRRASRVEENLGSLSVTLTSAQLTTLDAAGAAVAGNRTDDLTWVSAGRE